MRLRARHYRTGQPVDIVCRAGRIEAVEPPGPGPADLSSGWVAPAFCDVQINGCDRKSFGSRELTAADVRHVVGVCRSHGISELCPTLITGAREDLIHGFETLRRTCEEDADVGRAV